MTVLFVVATIVVLLGIDWAARRLRHEPLVPAAAHASPPAGGARMPDGIFFTPSHTWLNLFPSGKVRFGVDDFLALAVGRPAVTLLRRPGDEVLKGDPLVLLREGGRELTVRAPIDADVVDVNERLQHRPELMTTSLFSDGWAYTLKPRNFADLRRFSLGRETQTWMRIEFGRFRDFLASAGTAGGAAPAFLQDGGAPVDGALRAADDETWQAFQHEFLSIE